MIETETKKAWWPFRSVRNRSLIDANLVTVVPIEVAAQKLRGFIADHSAKITSTGADHLYMEISGQTVGNFRRGDDRPLPFLIELHFTEERTGRNEAQNYVKGDHLQTRVHVIVRPKKVRSGREQATDRARHLLVSLKSYLMAREVHEVGGAEDAPRGVDVGEPQVGGRG